jgi:hypothetical protein
MKDATTINNATYTVALHLDQKGYLYPSFSANHQDALERACAAHYDVGGSWPIGARCLVHGPCRDAECPELGKILTIEGVLNSEGLRVTNFQHR